MTKVLMNIKNGEVYFDCENHSKDYDVCTIVSTLCNVLVTLAESVGISPEIYEPGHVRIYIKGAEKSLIWAYEGVYDVFKEVCEQNKEYIKIY